MRIAMMVLGVMLVASQARADQPYVRRALDYLERAAHALESTAKDKDGHRDRALEKIEKATYELQQALTRDD
jgi:hypothetical protein